MTSIRLACTSMSSFCKAGSPHGVEDQAIELPRSEELDAHVGALGFDGLSVAFRVKERNRRVQVAQHFAQMTQALFALAQLAVECGAAFSQGVKGVSIAIVVHSGEHGLAAAVFLVASAP